MAVIKCKMCGGDLLLKDGSAIAECEYCGTVQTVPLVDNEKKLTLFNRAHRLRRLCEFDKAAGIYEVIAAEFPEEAESYWGLVLCRYGIEYVDDPATGMKVPTCHRSSYSSILEDRDYALALEYADLTARRLYHREANQIEKLRQSIIALSTGEAPYDIFICYKETGEDGTRTMDSVLAQDLYDALSARGYRVFFSRISLEDKLGQEYEPYIFAALNSARVMLAVGTGYEHFNAVWVKNEWSRFLKLMEKDKSKHLIPCYKDMDAYDMPQEFAKLQAQDLGKVGAVQDLLRGVEKLMPKKKRAPVVIQERVVVSDNGNVTPLLRRAAIFLEDRDWSSADKYCEKVLDMDPENAEAYLGKLMAEFQVSTEEDLGQMAPECLNSANYQKALRFGDEVMEERLENIRRDTVYYAAKRLAAKKVPAQKQKNVYREAIAQFHTIPGWRDSTQQIETCQTLIREIEEREEAERLEKQRQEQLEEERKQKKEKPGKAERIKKTVVILCALIVLELLIYAILIPKLTEKQEKPQEANAKQPAAAAVEIPADITEATKEPVSPEYTAAEELVAQGKTAEAAIAFGKLGDYEDARERSFALWRKVAPPQVVSSANISTAAVKRDGTVLLAGYADSRQLQCQEWTDIISVSTCGFSMAGGGHTVGLKKDGTVVAVGANQWNQCDTSSWSDIVAIDTYGEYFTVGLKSDGTVVYTGSRGTYGAEGQTEIHELSSWKNIAAIRILGNTVFGIKNDGTVVLANIVGEYGLKREYFKDWSDIIAITQCWNAWNRHCIGLKADGTVIEIAIKTVYNADGTVTETVINDDTQHDVSHWSDIIAVASGTGFTIGLKSDGTVVSTGLFRGKPLDVFDWSDIAAISASTYAIGVMKDGSVVSIGDLDDVALVKNWPELIKNWTDIALPGQLKTAG